MLLTDHEIRLVLVDREMDTEELRKECERQSIPLEEGSTNDLWRMSAAGNTEPWPLGRGPHGTLEEVFERGFHLFSRWRPIPKTSALESEPSRSAVRMQLFSTSQERTKIGTIAIKHACRSLYSIVYSDTLHYQRSEKQFQNYCSRGCGNCRTLEHKSDGQRVVRCRS